MTTFMVTLLPEVELSCYLWICHGIVVQSLDSQSNGWWFESQSSIKVFRQYINPLKILWHPPPWRKWIPGNCWVMIIAGPEWRAVAILMWQPQVNKTKLLINFHHLLFSSLESFNKPCMGPSTKLIMTLGLPSPLSTANVQSQF